jgi:membrane-associated phospholipid phosphatase
VVNLIHSSAFLALLLTFASVLWMLKDESDRTRVLLFFGLLINFIYGSVQHAFMGAMGGILPWKYDYVLYVMDNALGFSAPAIARSAAPSVLFALSIAYQLMVPAMIVLYIFAADGRHRKDIAVAYFAEMVFGPLLYVLLPACGPIYAFHATWPNVQQHPGLQAVRLGGMPNAFPSLHLATAIVLLSFAKPGAWRILAAVFFAATAASTIVTGEHYVIDLAGGLIFGCFACNAGRRNYRIASVFFAMAALYAVLIRFTPGTLVSHPFLLREFVIASVAISAISIAATARSSYFSFTISGKRPESMVRAPSTS